MNRLVLVVVVIALAIGGWLLFRKEKPDATATATGSGAQASPTASTDPAPTPTPAPSLPSNTDVTHAVPPPTPANEYVVGDVRVRDHRAGSNAPLDIPPNVHRPNTRELPSTLTAALAQKVRGVLADCTKDLPADARGAHPRLEGQLVVGIKDHKMTVTGATMQLRDVSGDAAATTKSCIEQHSVGLETVASDQDDIDNYSIGVTFAVL
jgi:hypothetical protein